MNFFCHSLITSCSCEQSQALPGFYVLQAMKSWAGPGNEATNTVDPQLSNALFVEVKLQHRPGKQCVHRLSTQVVCTIWDVVLTT